MHNEMNLLCDETSKMYIGNKTDFFLFVSGGGGVPLASCKGKLTK